MILPFLSFLKVQSSNVMSPEMTPLEGYINLFQHLTSAGQDTPVITLLLAKLLEFPARTNISTKLQVYEEKLREGGKKKKKSNVQIT